MGGCKPCLGGTTAGEPVLVFPILDAYVCKIDDHDHVAIISIDMLRLAWFRGGNRTFELMRVGR